jgi:hypothetical protein
VADFDLYSQTLRSLGFRGVSKLFTNRLLSFNNVFILQKSLLSAAAQNPHRMQFTMSKVDDGDWDEILRQAHCEDTDSRREIFARALFFRNGFKNCYALRSKTGFLAHIQWLVLPEENDVISAHYRRLFLPLGRSEIMIENAFTFQRFRGLGLFAYATRHLLNLGRQQGYKLASTYVRSEKIASLNELIRLGFSFKRVVREYKFLGFTLRALDHRHSGRERVAVGQFDDSTGARAEGEREPEKAVKRERGFEHELR